MPYQPPYTVTAEMQAFVNEIHRLVGRLEGYQLLAGNLRLRRKNKIRSLHSSLAIEGNRLSIEQVTAILNGKRVVGPLKDVQEVENAIRVYDDLIDYDPYSEDELLATHGQLMQGLIADAGRYRQSGVGVVDGSKVIHIAPPAKRVPMLMGDLFKYISTTSEGLIIKSCVFHYEFEFIHPFSDGNGRMGRLWQTAILKTAFPDLAYVPIESMVHTHQQAYYQALSDSQSLGHSNPFILYSLRTIRDALQEQLSNEVVSNATWQERLEAFRQQLPARDSFSRKAYNLYHKQIASATTTRDLAKGVESGLLTKQGSLRTTTYTFVDI